ncbi:MAG: hypothetical protein HY300_08810, partial [Verrucomicrobia bacterium]|nr:hypothetical protein [Verrucomicrobiota bacterium]
MKTKFLSVAFVSAFVHFTAIAAEPSRVARPDFVAHEWGTFTSVQGADGIQFEWNPFEVAGLPSFVHDLNRPTPQSQAPRYYTYGAKTAFRTLQRMETPVIYFYADRETRVDVTVNFPNGRITEWFPQVAAPASVIGNYRGSVASWKNIRILP